MNLCTHTSRWPAGVYVMFFAVFFEKWCCNFTPRGSFHTCAGSVGEPQCECGPVGELPVRQIQARRTGCSHTPPEHLEDDQHV